MTTTLLDYGIWGDYAATEDGGITCTRNGLAYKVGGDCNTAEHLEMLAAIQAAAANNEITITPYTTPAPPTLAELKATKAKTIEYDRDVACISDVTAHSRTWQADSRSQELLNSAINLAANGVPLPPVWRDADNNDMPITALSDLVSIAAAIAAQTQTAYTTSWARKAALAAAETAEEVEAV